MLTYDTDAPTNRKTYSRDDGSTRTATTFASGWVHIVERDADGNVESTSTYLPDSIICG